MVGLGWTVSITFIIPILLFEDYGIRGSFHRSALIIRQRWGDNLTSNVSVGVPILLLAVFGFAVSLLLAFLAQPLLAIVVALLTIGAALTCNAALNGIYRAALFQYATQGIVAAHLNFTPKDMAAAFKPARGSR